MIPIQEHIIRSMIPEWNTNSLLCFLVKNFVYQSLTDLTVMLFSEYLSVSHIDHREVPHSTFFFILMVRVYSKFSFTIIYTSAFSY